MGLRATFKRMADRSLGFAVARSGDRDIVPTQPGPIEGPEMPGDLHAH